MGAESTSLCTWVKHLPNLLRNKVNNQQYPSVYEDRPKSIEDTEKTDSKGIPSGQKVPGNNARTRVTAAPGPCDLMASSPAKQGLSSTERDLVA